MKKRTFAALLVLAVCAGIVFANFDTLRQMIPTPFFMTDMVYADDGAERYYYHQLPEDAQIAYTRILNEIAEHPEEIEIPPLDDETFHALFLALSYDNPALLCLENESELITRGAKAYFRPQYRTDADTCRAQTQALEAAAQEVLRQASGLSTAYEKELFFHDYICETVSYAEADESLGYSAYDALVTGEAVCEGYSRALQLLLDSEGIPNLLVTGVGVEEDGTREGHMWNLVSLDGEYYHVDLTWDDLDEDGGQHVSHAYFNVTDETIRANHEDISPAHFSCTATKDNYFVRSGLYFTTYDSVCTIAMTRAAAEAIRSGRCMLEVRFADAGTFSAAADDLVDEHAIYDVLDAADRQYAQTVDEVLYIRGDATCTLQFAF